MLEGGQLGSQAFCILWIYFLFQDGCNQMQLLRDSGGRGGAALRAVPSNFKAADHDGEAAIALNLALQPIEQVAFKFRDLATAQAGHVNVIPLRTALVIMLLALHVHEVKLVHQAVALEQIEGAVNRDPVDVFVELPRAPQDLTGVKMLLGGFHHAQDGAALPRHTQATRHQLGLQSSRRLGLRKRHNASPRITK